MDWGKEAFFDTLEILNKAGIHTCGAGVDIDAARRPASIKRKNIRVAALAYSSILPYGYWAEPDRPGCAPMRSYTYYEQIEHDQPGTPARVHTFPHIQDREALIKDIEMVRKESDIVLVSIHWGIHFIPVVIAAYQRELARSMIEAGADIILGHHPHILKGVEIYNGKLIFYSLGNFAIEQPSAFMKDLENDSGFKTVKALNPGWNAKQRYMIPQDTRMTLIVKCRLTLSGIAGVTIIPCYINDNSEPQVLSNNDPRFGKIVTYLQTISDHETLNTKFITGCGEVCIREKR